VKIQVLETIEDFKRHFGLPFEGILLEPDLDVVEVDTDAHERKRRDAEVLCTLAANSTQDVLELGTSHGRGAYKLATNLSPDLRCHTVNILPEQHDDSGGRMVTHLIPKSEIGSYYRDHGLQNVVQHFANTARWEIPNEIHDAGMVFVDAAHDEQNVYLDSKLVWNRIAPGGFIVWHDFSPFNRHFDWINASMRGVERFIREYGLDNAEIVNLRHSWCGVLRKPCIQSASPSPKSSHPTVATNRTSKPIIPSAQSTAVPAVSMATLRSLRYAIVYPAYSANRVNEEKLMAAHAIHLGLNVEAIGIPCFGGWWPFPVLDQKWRSHSADLMSRYGTLEERLRQKDVLIAAGGAMLHPDFIRQLSTFNVFYCADDPESSHILSKPVAAAFDLACVANIACVNDYASWGVRHAVWLPIPVSDHAIDRFITEESILTGTRNVDLIMCCERVYGLSDRAQRLERLQQEFPHAILRGKGWPNGFISDAELRGFYRRSRIGWNLHNSTGPVNSRLMMLPSFGVMQICDCRENLGKIFKLGEEVVGFETMDECVDATRYYLAHESERRRIALGGWKRVMADYTESKWWDRLLQSIAPLISQKLPLTSRSTPPLVTCST